MYYLRQDVRRRYFSRSLRCSLHFCLSRHATRPAYGIVLGFINNHLAVCIFLWLTIWTLQLIRWIAVELSLFTCLFSRHIIIIIVVVVVCYWPLDGWLRTFINKQEPNWTDQYTMPVTTLSWTWTLRSYCVLLFWLNSTHCNGILNISSALNC